MKEIVYYRNLIESLLKEQPDNDIPPMPNRKDIEKRKITHMVKMGKLPSWVEKAETDGQNVYFSYSSRDHVDIGFGWHIYDWSISAKMIGNEAHHSGIYVHLVHTSDAGDEDDALDAADDLPIDALQNAMNNIFSDYFESIVDDVVFEDWDHNFGPNADILISSDTVNNIIENWIPLLLKK